MSNNETRRIIITRCKDLNARGNGEQETRRVRLPDGTTGWASDLAQDSEGTWSNGTFFAADRHCAQRGRFPVGTLVVAYHSTIRGGQKNGPADITAGIVVGLNEGRIIRQKRGVDDGRSDSIEWGLSTRRRGRAVEVETPDGQWVEI